MMKPDELCFKPAIEIADLIRKKELSPVDVVKVFLERIDAINPKVNAYCTVDDQLALEMAREAEKKVIDGTDLGPLTGVPVAIKDVALTRGLRTTFGSKLYADYIPDRDSAVVERLRTSGAIILGKTNTPEFAAGGSTYNELFGATRTPWNIDYNSGGSSGGSAAALASGLCPVAHGNDLGGSLRIPASFCGVVGLRPSPGRVPGYPNELNWDTMSLEGPMARTVKDLALLLDVMSGPDQRSPVALLPKEDSFFEQISSHHKPVYRAAWGSNLGLTPVDSEVLQIASNSVNVFKDLGYQIGEGYPDLSGLQETAATLRGIRFAALYQDELDNKEFQDTVNPNIIKNIELGLSLSGSEVARAEKQRSIYWQRMLDFFNHYDLIITPTVPVKPFLAEQAYPTEINGKEMDNYIDWIMLTYAFSVLGVPAISIPCGWSGDGFPVGLQIAGRPGREVDVLQAALAFEEQKPWHQNKPSF